jgi:hypothetical protein
VAILEAHRAFNAVAIPQAVDLRGAGDIRNLPDRAGLLAQGQLRAVRPQNVANVRQRSGSEVHDMDSAVLMDVQSNASAEAILKIHTLRVPPAR